MVIEQFMNLIYQGAINVIIGSDKRQLLPWDQWPVDKENGSATKGYKIERKWETFHLLISNGT